jgi:phenylacetate 2-hydroxylase
LSKLLTIPQWSYRTDVPKIKGLYEIPNALPVVGHLPQLGGDHASACEQLWRKYGQSTFQIRLGYTRAVVCNSFRDANRILQHSSVIDRPTLHTFHGVISATSGFTIGSSPWNESTKRRRTAAGTLLSAPATRRYFELFDRETYKLIADTYQEIQKGNHEIRIHPYIQRLALRTILNICYGVRDLDNDLLEEIRRVGSEISLLRSASENYQDHVPIFRYIPNNLKTQRAKELRQGRDEYLNILLDKVRENVDNGTDTPCVAVSIIKGDDKKLSASDLSCICLSFVSGGFETIPATLISCIGSLSTVEGQVFQNKAYSSIIQRYKTTKEAWDAPLAEDTIPYINALVKEAARYYTASGMNLPRMTTTPVNWDGIIIPEKTVILVNLQGANHDIDHFGKDASTFNPERWLQDGEHLKPRLAHLSFGGGARACPGYHVAERVIYDALVRLLISYRIVASDVDPPNTDYRDYNERKSALVAVPKDFKVKLIPREPSELEKCLK